MASQYPLWKYYPPRSRPPVWADAIIVAFFEAQTR
jgi:hypothetical protein